KHADRSHPVWSQASLHLCHYAPLDQRHIRESRQQGEDHDCAFDDCGHDCVIEKVKHAPPPAPGCAHPVAPVLPSLDRHRKDSLRQSLVISLWSWYSSTLYPYAWQSRRISPNQLSLLAGAVTPVE